MASKAAVALLLLALIQAASALPLFFASKPGNCGKHPGKNFGPHLAPTTDKNIVITIRPASGGKAIKAPGPLRPNTKYSIKVTYKQAAHRGLLTVSQGTLATINPSLKNCKLSNPETDAKNVLTNVVTLSKTAKGNITFGVTHSMPGMPYYQGTVTYRVQPRTGKML